MKTLVISLTLYLVCWPGQTLALEFTGRVIEVFDGDTITVLHNEVSKRIRLNGIDCPETRQLFGIPAKEFTTKLALGKTVTVRILDQDHDRARLALGDVILPDGRVLNRELMASGLAWWYRAYSDDQTLARLEQEARVGKRGIWAGPNPLPPWEFRLKAIPP